MSPIAFDSGLNSAVSGALTRFQALDVVANNLANANTTGFKRDVASFDQVLDQATGTASIKIRETVTDQNQGTLRTTGAPFDLAIEGKGFFQIETPEGLRYTRNGAFTRNADGQLVTLNGDLVMGSGGPLTIVGQQVEIGNNGTVTVDGTNVGSLALFDFADGVRLIKQGSNLFAPPDGVSPSAVQPPNVIQGALETSNVNVMQEMIRMVEFQREFETFQKMIKTYNTMAVKADEIGTF